MSTDYSRLQSSSLCAPSTERRALGKPVTESAAFICQICDFIDFFGRTAKNKILLTCAKLLSASKRIFLAQVAVFATLYKAMSAFIQWRRHFDFGLLSMRCEDDITHKTLGLVV